MLYYFKRCPLERLVLMSELAGRGICTPASDNNIPPVRCNRNVRTATLPWRPPPTLLSSGGVLVVATTGKSVCRVLGDQTSATSGGSWWGREVVNVTVGESYFLFVCAERVVSCEWKRGFPNYTVAKRKGILFYETHARQS